ncbi:MAG: RNA methyltransferase [Alphaproteobacteria bacterium]|nr:RNA methyltransferase [Alphaproteobacteria bacterium]
MSRPPAIVLVRPQLGENIGMAARAMLNCGLDELRIVAPRDGWPNPAARAAAAGADAAIDGARVFGTAAEAVADLQLVLATTARRRDLEKPVHGPREAARLLRDSGARTGVLFGPERSGLDNDELGLAAAIVEAPLNPDFPSLNLAQAVFLVAWEWRMAGPAPEPPPASELASAEAFEGFWQHLDTALEDAGYYREPKLKPTTQRNLRALFTRVGLTGQEVRTLRGVIARLASRGRGKD